MKDQDWIERFEGMAVLETYEVNKFAREEIKQFIVAELARERKKGYEEGFRFCWNEREKLIKEAKKEGAEEKTREVLGMIDEFVQAIGEGRGWLLAPASNGANTALQGLRANLNDTLTK